MLMGAGNNADLLVFPVYDSIEDTSPAKRLSLSEVVSMAQNPRIGPKKTAPAITPYLADGKRKEHAWGADYYALVFDDDHGNATTDGIRARFDKYNIGYFAFTTSSHQQPGKGNRWKVFIPFVGPVEHDQWIKISIGLMLMFDGDPAQARSQQVFYAPNKLSDDAPYEFIDEITRPFVEPLDTSHAFIKDCLHAFTEDEKKKAEQAKTSTPKPRNVTGTHGTIIEKVNLAYTMADVLAGHSYARKGRKYLSPFSESGMPGVVILPGGRAYSHHGSGDPLSNLNNGGHSLDVFDVICILEYGGDVHRAVKELANIVDPAGQRERQREYMQQQETPENESSEQEQTEFDMAAFSMKGQSSEMEKQMLDDKFVLGNLAILGQSTVFYAGPNTGKTLLTIYLIKEAIKAGEINGDDIFYINADDTYKGLVYKLKIAEKYGFHMLAPGHGPAGGPVFKSDDLSIYLKKMIKQNTAAGKVLILDTTKKFTDLMSKEKSSNFMEVIRQFISHGGTAVMLAHVNKHRDENKKVIYSGTADMVDDADCAYTLDIIQEDYDGTRTVKFENFKARGDVALEAFYQYDYRPGTLYYDRLDSVAAVDDDERKRVEQQHALDIQLKKNQVAVDVIIECIKEGLNKKTELITEAAARSGVSKPKIRKALIEHTGTEKSKNQFWHEEVGDKNTHTYHLNYGVSDAV